MLKVPELKTTEVPGDVTLLSATVDDPLRLLREEFDGLVRGMQTEEAKRAGHSLFAATPARLGKAAVENARRRG